MEVTDVNDTDSAVNKLGDPRQHLDLQSGLGRKVSKIAYQVCSGRRNRDQQQRGARTLDDIRERTAPALHRDAHQAKVTLPRVVVEDRNWPIRAVRLAEHRPNDLVAPLTRPEDDKRS